MVATTEQTCNDGRRMIGSILPHKSEGFAYTLMRNLDYYERIHLQHNR